MEEAFYSAAREGAPADLGIYKGKVALVVNVASYCGFTPQYTGLEKLHRDMKAQGVVVLGFPSDVTRDRRNCMRRSPRR